MNGCQDYFRLLAKANAEPDNAKARVLYSVAWKHNRDCPLCKRINTPLAEQLFGEKVVVKA